MSFCRCWKPSTTPTSIGSSQTRPKWLGLKRNIGQKWSGRRRQKVGGWKNGSQKSSAQHSEKQVPRYARDDNSFDLQSMLEQPLALRRRAVRAVFERVSGKALDFEH